MAERILIVDDDPVQRRLLENMITRAGFEAIVAEGGDAAAALLTGSEGARFDAVVLDLVMPDLDGLGVLAKMREAGLSIPVIVQTAHGGIDNVVNRRCGRARPISWSSQSALNGCRSRCATRSMRARCRANSRGSSARRTGTLTFRDIITRSPAMLAVLRLAEKAAGSAIPVLIEGQSGVGKELIARAIHGTGERRAKPFIAVNCGAIPDNLVESILFGHEKGAFTGATERHVGKFVEASGGTLFLDEIGELPPAAQVKLLRAIQEGEVEPVGGRRPVKVDVRLVSATNRDLIADVKTGRFREDLFYRLHVFPITVPPLCERPEDIPELTRHFLARFAAEEGKRIARVSGEALSLLRTHRWPGNVRQLENAVFRAVVLAEGDEVGIGEFPHIAAQGPGGVTALEAVASEPIEMHYPPAPPLAQELPGAHAMPLTAPSSGAALMLVDGQGEARSLEEIETEVIRFAIAHYHGQMSEVARRLRIGRSTLYRKLDAMGLDTANSLAQDDPVVAG